ncbi:hypothetical protein KUCAC02_024444, partial [Chaenocephalus aceratus]
DYPREEGGGGAQGHGERRGWGWVGGGQSLKPFVIFWPNSPNGNRIREHDADIVYLPLPQR